MFQANICCQRFGIVLIGIFIFVRRDNVFRIPDSIAFWLIWFRILISVWVVLCLGLLGDGIDNRCAIRVHFFQPILWCCCCYAIFRMFRLSLHPHTCFRWMVAIEQDV